jgi:hypothetical protein
MPESTRLWETVVDRVPRIGLAAGFGLSAVVVVAAAWPLDIIAVLVVGAVLSVLAVVLRRASPVRIRLPRPLTYHSDDDGVLVASDAGRLQRASWDAVCEVRETTLGAMILTTGASCIRFPRRVARRDAFGMAVFERVIPRLAGELWDALVKGRMVTVCQERQRIGVLVVLALAVGAGLMIAGGLGWALAAIGVGLFLVVWTRLRARGVFLSSRGVGDRDRFIAWETAEIEEHRWSLIVRDTATGWIARIPRTAVNYHAIAVVAAAAQVLSGSGVESVAFRTASDSGRIRIVVEGSLPSGAHYH